MAADAISDSEEVCNNSIRGRSGEALRSQPSGRVGTAVRPYLRDQSYGFYELYLSFHAAKCTSPAS